MRDTNAELAAKLSESTAALTAERARFVRTIEQLRDEKSPKSQPREGAEDAEEAPERAESSGAEQDRPATPARDAARSGEDDNFAKRHTVHNYVVNGNTVLKLIDEDQPHLGARAVCRSGYTAVVGHREELSTGTYTWRIALDESSTRVPVELRVGIVARGPEEASFGAVELDQTFCLCLKFGELSLNRRGARVPLPGFKFSQLGDELAVTLNRKTGVIVFEGNRGGEKSSVEVNASDGDARLATGGLRAPNPSDGHGADSPVSSGGNSPMSQSRRRSSLGNMALQPLKGNTVDFSRRPVDFSGLSADGPPQRFYVFAQSSGTPGAALRLLPIEHESSIAHSVREALGAVSDAVDASLVTFTAVVTPAGARLEVEPSPFEIPDPLPDRDLVRLWFAKGAVSAPVELTVCVCPPPVGVDVLCEPRNTRGIDKISGHGRLVGCMVDIRPHGLAFHGGGVTLQIPHATEFVGDASAPGGDDGEEDGPASESAPEAFVRRTSSGSWRHGARRPPCGGGDPRYIDNIEVMHLQSFNKVCVLRRRPSLRCCTTFLSVVIECMSP